MKAARARARVRPRSGQSAVEYMVAIVGLVMVIAAGFLQLGEATKGVFHNARATVQLPYP